MINKNTEIHFHNERASNESEHSDRLGYVYHSLANALNKPLSSIPENAKNILEIGCYLGDSCKSISNDINYTGIDVSDVAIKKAEIKYSNENTIFKTHDAHELSNLNKEYDYIFGNGVLHHLDLKKFIIQLSCTLANGGTAIFLEPIQGPPWLRLFRYLTPSLRTPDEHPLVKQDFILFKSYFDISIEYYGLLCPIIPMVFLNNKYITKMMQYLDNKLSAILPDYFWITVIKFKHKNV